MRFESIKRMITEEAPMACIIDKEKIRWVGVLSTFSADPRYSALPLKIILVSLGSFVLRS